MVKKTIIGYMLTNRYAQISYRIGTDGEPETVSAVTGEEQFNIPAVLCKKKGANQWWYGKEAIKYAGQEGGILLENIYELALTGEMLRVDQEDFDPAALLTLFIKRSLGLVNAWVKKDKVGAIMFTVEELTLRTVAMFKQIAAGLEMPPEKIFLQSYCESIYHYVMHQPRELWNQQVLIFDYDGQMKAYRLECNRKTTPVAVFVQAQEFPQFPRYIPVKIPIQPDKAAAEKAAEAERGRFPPPTAAPPPPEADREFLALAGQMCHERFISAVYLVGEGFKADWLGESLKFLCRGRRVFQGNNLYSKGACYGAGEKYRPTEISTAQVFLGEDKLKSNIGMKVRRRGQDSYFAVLDAGVNWYEQQNQCDLIMDEGNELSFIITSLTGGVVTERILLFEDLPERPPRTTRLQLHFRMSAADRVEVTVTDQGFGDLFPATGTKWVREFTV